MGGSNPTACPINPDGHRRLQALKKEAEDTFKELEGVTPELREQQTRFTSFLEALLMDGDPHTLRKLHEKIKEKGIEVEMDPRHSNNPGLLFLLLRVVKGKIPPPQMALYVFLIATLYYPIRAKPTLASFYEQGDLMSDPNSPIVAALQIFAQSDYPMPHYAKELVKDRPSLFRALNIPEETKE